MTGADLTGADMTGAAMTGAAMTRWAGATLGAILGVAVLAGCDPGMRFHVRSPEEQLSVLPREVTASMGTVISTARYVGPGELVPTSHNVIGAVMRTVNPFGADQILFETEIRNDSQERITVLPDDARLDTGTRKIAALGLGHYKRIWPTYPIVDLEMAKDQAVAFTYVLRSILVERHVLPGETVRGKLVFPAPAGAIGPLRLSLPLRSESGTGSVEFDFKVEYPTIVPEGKR